MKKMFTDKIDRLFLEWDRPDSPGFSLAIVENGKIAYKRGYGMASLEHGVPISTASVFDVGSMSKQFVAFCVAILVRKGVLSLGDSVRKHIPEIPDYGHPLTIRHLIHHTSGVRDYLTLMELAGMRFENEYPDEEIIGLITKQNELNFKPGQEFLYSNSGYLLLGEIVKRVSGQSLRSFAEENIFGPLGMKKTHFHDDFSEVVKNKAMGYSAVKNGFKVSISIFDVVGDGGVNTTVEDLFLWDQNFYHNELAGGGQDVIKEVITPGRLNNGTVLDYAYGLFNAPYRGIKMISHGGSWIGYKAEMLRFPQKRFSVICLANLGNVNPTRIAKQIADICLFSNSSLLEKKQQSGLPGQANMLLLKDLTGFYLDSKTSGVAEIFAKDGKMILAKGGVNHQLESVGVNNYVADTNAFHVKLEPCGPNKIFRMKLKKEGGRPEIYFQAGQCMIPSSKLKSFEGDYYCGELDTWYKIGLEDGALRLSRKWEAKEALRPVQARLFSGTSVTLKFFGNNSGNSTEFRLGAGRVKNLIFRRKKPS